MNLLSLQDPVRIGAITQMRMYGRGSNVLKMLLVVLFAWYYADVTFYSHVHSVAGRLVVHSHPYSTDTSGSPVHSHTHAELQTIQFLSLFALLLVAALLFAAVFRSSLGVLRTFVHQSLSSTPHNIGFGRAPPVVC